MRNTNKKAQHFQDKKDGLRLKVLSLFVSVTEILIMRFFSKKMHDCFV